MGKKKIRKGGNLSRVAIMFCILRNLKKDAEGLKMFHLQNCVPTQQHGTRFKELYLRPLFVKGWIKIKEGDPLTQRRYIITERGREVLPLLKEIIDSETDAHIISGIEDASSSMELPLIKQDLLSSQA